MIKKFILKTNLEPMATKFKILTCPLVVNRGKQWKNSISPNYVRKKISFLGEYDASEFSMIQLSHNSINLHSIGQINYPIYRVFPWPGRQHASVGHYSTFHELYFSMNLRPKSQHAPFLSVSN